MYSHQNMNGAGPSHQTELPNNHQQSSVPDVPGEEVDEGQTRSLSAKVASLCGLRHSRFPGAQPVSFARSSLDQLKEEDYWVCEKSDGQRVLMFIAWNKATEQQEVYLIDRKNKYKRQHNSIVFPFHEIPPSPKARMALQLGSLNEKYAVRKDTLLDGELVWDVSKTGERKMRLLLFDCIILDGSSLAQRPLSRRYGSLMGQIVPPHKQFLKEFPAAARDAPFEVQVKRMQLAYHISTVLDQFIPNLEHGNDGLIFTCVNSGYIFGTDPKIIKWKPPSENTIDFKLRLRFPPDLAKDPRGNLPDLQAKPFFQLDEFIGGTRDNYRYFDWLYVEDDEWEDMKASGEQFDDRVVECSWDPNGGPLEASQKANGANGELDSTRPPCWRLHRIRDDKHDGNHTTIVQKIIQSIVDGVEKDELLQEEGTIRSLWKSEERERFRQAREKGRESGGMDIFSKKRGAPPPMRGQPPSWFRRL